MAHQRGERVRVGITTCKAQRRNDLQAFAPNIANPRKALGILWTRRGQIGSMYSGREASELCSSPPRIRNGCPSTISCVAAPCRSRCGIETGAERERERVERQDEAARVSAKRRREWLEINLERKLNLARDRPRSTARYRAFPARTAALERIGFAEVLVVREIEKLAAEF
jgi:hypothetical protein